MPARPPLADLAAAPRLAAAPPRPVAGGHPGDGERAGVRGRPSDPRAGVLLRYPDRLPLTAATPRITLGEGGTPLIEAPTIARELGLGRLSLKFEGLNPTGSFKDRGMVVAVAKAIEAGSEVLVCASTGNTSASAAAYAARFGLRAVVLVPGGKIAPGKLLQAQVYGAKVLAIRGNFDRALAVVRELAARYPIALVNSVNPYRIEGQKTAAFEIVDALGDAPDVLSLPVGNAGNITAYWRGFREEQPLGRVRRLPRLLGVQAEGSAPIVRGRAVARPRTVASAIRIGNPASWEAATLARDESGGAIIAATDGEILTAQRWLASREGVFAEPASAAALAGVVQAARSGWIAAGAEVVCVLTGHGLKDPDAASAELPPPIPVDDDPAAIAKLLKL
ncbi:MAG TPA: threonine synthase [Candidatus Micrarchaeia archaeon]|nr:threonine synthase [Candidatus Micrarchaeia archaeon]